MHRRVDLSSRRISSQYFESDFESGFRARENEHILSPFESEFRVRISSHAQDLSSISSQDFESSVAGFRRSCHGRILNSSLGVLMAETQEILSLKSPRRNVTIAWLSSGNTFDLLISLSCLFLMRQKSSPYLRVRQMKINTLFNDRNPKKPFPTGWHIPI